MQKIKDFVGWIFGNVRLFIEVLLVAALLISGFLYRRQEATLVAVKAQYTTLADNLREQITIKNGEIQTLRRENGKVTVHTVYVPQEGSVVIQVSSSTGNTTTIIQDKGWTLKPGFGVELGTEGIQGHLDVKFLYFQRYSAFVGGTRYNLGVGVSRHISDLTWFKPLNAELFLEYSPIRSTDMGPLSLGVRSNF